MAHNRNSDDAMTDLFIVEFRCSYSEAHTIIFIFKIVGENILKVGQYPSVADLREPAIKQYKKVLGNDRHRDFHQALGLISHGLGVGAFVYLRRVFEFVIEKTRDRAAAELAAWDETAFRQAKMDEKIGLIKDFLPPFLVENRVVYSILSLGVHSLTDEECRRNFDVVRISIELILDQELERQQQRAKLDQAKQALALTHQQVKPK